ncbi:hypothetical protein BGZ96_006639 [Linnemannia gamsii]|uniref:F-box domain-containing protein n=1 Tax=Linnemannia gamsii TaxID=64522 RepID=A0ABQ7K2L5_9FUNG|nr:hypothetical protein BGZ96_006639 [Linnemannia gamsii]
MSEATDVIGTHLSPPDLLSCILVCRTWKTLFIPHLYETFDDTQYSGPVVLERPKWRKEEGNKDRDADWILTMFTTYGHLIRRLCTGWTISLNTASAAGTCTLLRSVAIRGLRVDDLAVERDHPILSNLPTSSTTSPLQQLEHKSHWIAKQWLWHLIDQNSATLRELEIADINRFLTDTNFTDLLTSCPRLSRLALSLTPGERLQILLDKLPELQHYEFIYPKYYFPPDTIEDYLLLASSVSSLVSLRITGSVGKETYFNLLKHLPNLQHLWIEGQYSIYSKRLTGLISPPTRLQRLDYTRQNAQLNDQLIPLDILDCSPELTNVSVPFLTIEIARSIVANCPNVQSFRESTLEQTVTRSIKRHGVIDSAGMLLEKCRHLTVLDAVHMEISAEHLIAHSWICQGLEIFRCQIIRVGRLSEEEEMDYRQGLLFQRIGRPLSKNESAALEKYHNTVRTQHRLIYNQLAKMTNLKVLDLGMEFRGPRDFLSKPMIQRGAQVYREYNLFLDTLELSLASGLDRLATLDKLEVFGFESVDHRIDEEELQWMAERWPRLRIMRGLQEPLVHSVMHDGERWYRRVFMQRLRPSIRHEGHPRPK